MMRRVSDETDKTPPSESDDARVARQIEELPPAEAARVLGKMPSEEAADVAEYLDPQTAAEILGQLDAPQAAAIVEDMEPPEAAVLLGEMDPDDRVDVLEHVDEDVHEQIVSELDQGEREEVRKLEQYEPDTAGGIMTTEVSALEEHLTVGQAIEQIRRLNEQLEQLFYSYVVDAEGRLVGVLSMRDMILAKPETPIRDIMIRRVTSVPATMDQEDVARVMREKRFLALPVTDEGGKLIGLITADDVQHVIEEEATEDVQKLFGAGAEERLTSPWTFSFRKRVWWLVVNLATAFIAAAVVGLFDDTIAKVSILAAYMPIVAGMGGNASAQAMAVTVRGLAMGYVDRKLLRHVLRREAIVGLLTGLVCGAITGLIAIGFPGETVGSGRALMLGLVVFLSLVFNHALACTSGAAIPFVLKKLGFDPAQSATIFATTVTDVAGFFALLGLATILLL